jgi:hypothetical protein
MGFSSEKARNTAHAYGTTIAGVGFVTAYVLAIWEESNDQDEGIHGKVGAFSGVLFMVSIGILHF